MQMCPYREGKIVIQRLANERVHETETSERQRQLLDEACRHRRTELLEHPIGGDLASHLQQPRIELSPDHGGEVERLTILGGEEREPLADGCTQLDWELHPQGSQIGTSERLLGVEQPHELP